MEGECRRVISYLQAARYSYHKPYCNKLSNHKPTAHTIRSIRRTIYTECGARLKNLHSSNILSLYLSLSFPNISYLSKITKLFTIFFGKNAVLNMCRLISKVFIQRKRITFSYNSSTLS